MKGDKKIFTGKHIATALLMLLSLAWLTISTPFVYAHEQVKKELSEKQCTEENCNNPFSKSSGEKSESGTGTLSEYLHEVHFHERVSSFIAKYYKCHLYGLYFAFHPDLISPPPKG